MATGICPNCDAPNEYTASYCQACGQLLPWANAQAAVASSESAGAPEGRIPEGRIPEGTVTANPYASPPPPSFPPQPSISYDQPPSAAAGSRDSGSLGMAILGFVFPLIGIILYFVWNGASPRRAASAGKGALAGIGLQVLACVAVVVMMGSMARGKGVSVDISINKQRAGQIVLAMDRYALQNGGRLPDMSSSSAMKAQLQPVWQSINQKGEPIFENRSGVPFEPNKALSGQNKATILNPSKTILFYEGQPTGWSRCVAFADGNVESVLEREWPERRRASGLPD